MKKEILYLQLSFNEVQVSKALLKKSDHAYKSYCLDTNLYDFILAAVVVKMQSSFAMV